MTQSKFFLKGDVLSGFSVDGHSGAGMEGSDIVCAAISSAAYMTVNTITDVCGCLAEAEADDGHLLVMVDERDVSRCQDILKGFQLHMEGLKEQYPRYIHIETVDISEV